MTADPGPPAVALPETPRAGLVHALKARPETAVLPCQYQGVDGHLALFFVRDECEPVREQRLHHQPKLVARHITTGFGVDIEAAIANPAGADHSEIIDTIGVCANRSSG